MALTRNSIVARFMNLSNEADLSLSASLVKNFATESFQFIEVLQAKYNKLDINLSATVTEPTITVNLLCQNSITHRNKQQKKIELCVLTMKFMTERLIVRYNYNQKSVLTNEKKYETDNVMSKDEILETIKNSGIKKQSKIITPSVNPWNKTLVQETKSEAQLEKSEALLEKSEAQLEKKSEAQLEKKSEARLEKKSEAQLEKKSVESDSDSDLCEICGNNHNTNKCKSYQRCGYNLCITGKHAHFFDRNVCRKVKCEICDYNHYTDDCRSYLRCKHPICVIKFIHMLL